jgi:hypothetical protein
MDQVVVKSKSESNETSSNSGEANQTIAITRSHALILCAAGLGISFFLPWVVLIRPISGFDLQKLGEQHLLLWLIPIFSVITIIAGFTKRSQRLAGQLTAALPFCVGIYWYNKLGNDLQHILTYGAFLSLMFGGALSIVARKLK